MIQELRDTITAQSQTIEALRVGQEEIKPEQGALAAQSTELRQEVHTLREQLKSPSRSWASVVATGSTTTLATGLRFPSQTNPYGGRENILRISTPPSTPEREAGDGSLTPYMETYQVSPLVAEALKKDTDANTQDIQVAGIGTTRAGYLIPFKDKQAKDVAYKNNEWLKNSETALKSLNLAWELWSIAH